MNNNTGEIISAIEWDKLNKSNPTKAKDFFKVSTTSDACPCNSSKKFCDCCFSKFKHLDRKNRRKQIRKFFKGNLISTK